jgi:hypothetical protein
MKTLSPRPLDEGDFVLELIIYKKKTVESTIKVKLFIFDDLKLILLGVRDFNGNILLVE